MDDYDVDLGVKFNSYLWYARSYFQISGITEPQEFEFRMYYDLGFKDQGKFDKAFIGAANGEIVEAVLALENKGFTRPSKGTAEEMKAFDAMNRGYGKELRRTYILMKHITDQGLWPKLPLWTMDPKDTIPLKRLFEPGAGALQLQKSRNEFRQEVDRVTKLLKSVNGENTNPLVGTPNQSETRPIEGRPVATLHVPPRRVGAPSEAPTEQSSRVEQTSTAKKRKTMAELVGTGDWDNSRDMGNGDWSQSRIANKKDKKKSKKPAKMSGTGGSLAGALPITRKRAIKISFNKQMDISVMQGWVNTHETLKEYNDEVSYDHIVTTRDVKVYRVVFNNWPEGKRIDDPAYWPAEITVEKWVNSIRPWEPRGEIKFFLGGPGIGQQTCPVGIRQHIEKKYKEVGLEKCKVDVVSFESKRNKDHKNFVIRVSDKQEPADHVTTLFKDKEGHHLREWEGPFPKRKREAQPPGSNKPVTQVQYTASVLPEVQYPASN